MPDNSLSCSKSLTHLSVTLPLNDTYKNCLRTHPKVKAIHFHPNAGLDPLAVSRKKRGGRDGISVRAFENAVL
jgi:hypothetical protein